MQTNVIRHLEAPAAATERRAVRRVLQHWRTICGRHEFPSRDDIDPAEIAADWRSCFIVDLAGRRDVPVFLYVGVALRIAALGDAVSARITQCPPGTVLAIATNDIDQVIESRLPVSRNGAAMHEGEAVLFRSILLPLSADGTQIDAVLGAANFRRVERSRLVIIDED
jgi:hypothetical protein